MKKHNSSHLVIMLLVTLILTYSLCSCMTQVAYDENQLQDYAHEQYAKIFASAGGVQDNILIVFITSEDHSSYHHIAVVGDHVMDDIYSAFCGVTQNNAYDWPYEKQQNDLDRAMSVSIAQPYKHTLDRSLSQMLDTMSDSMGDRASRFSVWCEESNVGVDTCLINQTDLSINQEMVNSSLLSLSECVGVPVVLLVEDEQDVFGKTVNPQLLFSFIPILMIMLCIVGCCVAVIGCCIIIRKKRLNYQRP